MGSSLEVTDQEAQAVAVAPRVTLKSIEEKIVERYDVRASDACQTATEIGSAGHPVNPLGVLSICILVMRNGFTVIGKSAPASPENFNEELGKKFAYEDAVRQLWPLEGYALRESLANGKAA